MLLDSIPVGLVGNVEIVKGYVNIINIVREFQFEVKVLSPAPIIVTNVTDQLFSGSKFSNEITIAKLVKLLGYLYAYFYVIDTGVKVYNVTGFFEDPEGLGISYLTPTLTNGSALPSWVSFSADTFNFQTTSTLDSIEILLTASDTQGQTKSQTFNVSVTNLSPVVASSLSPLTVYESVYSYSVAKDLSVGFSDPDTEQQLIYAVSGVPPFFTSAISGGVLTLTGRPDTSHIGSYMVTVTVTDGFATVGSTFNMEVVENQPPVAPSLPDINVNVGDDDVYIVPGFSDLESDALIYELKFSNGSVLDPTWISFNAFNREIGYHIYDYLPPVVELELTVKDPYNFPIVKLFKFYINFAPKVNNAVAILTHSLIASKTSKFSINGGLFYDEDPQLHYSLKLQDGSPSPSWISMTPPHNSLSGNFEFTGYHPVYQLAPIYFSLIATDSKGLTTNVTLTVTIQCKYCF